MPSIGGFWSYAHSDDENDGGRLKALANRLRAEYKLLTSEELELFVDEGLLWGDDWREKIAQALERVTFFIPIITPTYFRRSECRRELMRFAREAKAQQAERLILPIYYVEVPELEADVVPADEAMAIVKPLQRQDLRQLRLASDDDATYRHLVNKLATRIIEIAREAEQVSSPAIAPPEGPRQLSHESDENPDLERASDADKGDRPFLERMAQGEEAMEKIQGPLEAINLDMRALGQLSQEASEEIEAADAAGKPGFASRLAAARRLASRLGEPAKDMEQHSQEYISLLWEVDPFVLGMLDIAKTWDAPEEQSEKQSFLEGTAGLITAGRESSQSFAGLIETLEGNLDYSRELRQPLRIYQTSLRNIIDAQSVIDQWARRLDEIDDTVEPPPRADEDDTTADNELEEPETS